MVFSNVAQPLTLTHRHFILCGPDLTRMSPGPAHRRGSQSWLCPNYCLFQFCSHNGSQELRKPISNSESFYSFGLK